MTLSHFSAALVFSVLTSVVFGITQRNTSREMLLYGLKCFAFFVVGIIAGAWVMWMIRH